MVPIRPSGRTGPSPGVTTIQPLIDLALNLACPDHGRDSIEFLAGGHDGIAGSPRGEKMTQRDLAKAVSTFSRAIEKADRR